MKKTLIIGASTNPDRYAFMAAEKLLKYGHEIELLGKKKGEVSGNIIKNYSEEISKDIDTVTMYLSAKNQEEYEPFILELKPKRIIFNPGAENEVFAQKLEKEGIETVEGCTLVMLQTGQF